MSFPSSNVVRLVPRHATSNAQLPARPGPSDDLRSLETLSSNLALLKRALTEAIASYSRDCVAAGGTDPSERLSTLLGPVETLQAGMHRLASAMAAHGPR